MMISLYLLSLYTALLISPKPSPPTVQSVVKEHIVYLGGVEKLEKLKNQHIEQRITINDISLSQTLYIYANKSVYQKTHSTAMGTIIGFYSTIKNWKTAPYLNGGKRMPLEEQEIKTLRQKTYINGLLYEYYKGNIKPKSVRLVKYPRSKRDVYYELQITIDSDVLTYYIHKDTWRVDKLVVNKEVTITYSDYKQNKGYWYPYTQTIDIQNNITKIQVQKLEINEEEKGQRVISE